MKKATCKELKGACEEIITGATAEEMAKNSRAHAMLMLQKNDKAHIAAMEEMKKMPLEEQQKWYGEFVKNFDSLENA